jgi:hypothetical protein
MRALVIAALALCGCIKTGEFKCADSADCDRGGVQGICQSVGYCSFSDAACPSGQRFADLSGEVSNDCVEGTGDSFPVGGTITGLTGSVTLANNGADELTRTTNGDFTFAAQVPDSTAYLVTVTAQPVDQTCIVTNGSGTIATAAVVDVVVTCGELVTGTVLCATGLECPNATQFCCYDSGANSGTCVADGGQCALQRVECDSADDCGGGVAVCCASYQGGNLRDATCKANAAACVPVNTTELWCDDAAGAGACPNGQTCTGAPMEVGPGFTSCE